MQKTEIEKAAEEYAATQFSEDCTEEIEVTIDAFTAGAEYAAPKWVSVETALPEAGTGRLLAVLQDSHSLEEIHMVVNFKEAKWIFPYDPAGRMSVKYWMKLPELPKPPKV